MVTPSSSAAQVSSVSSISCRQRSAVRNLTAGYVLRLRVLARIRLNERSATKVRTSRIGPCVCASSRDRHSIHSGDDACQRVQFPEQDRVA
jgi:hypothetical protein